MTGSHRVALAYLELCSYGGLQLTVLHLPLPLRCWIRDTHHHIQLVDNLCGILKCFDVIFLRAGPTLLSHPGLCDHKPSSKLW